MEEIRAGDGVLDVQGHHQDVKRIRTQGGIAQEQDGCVFEKKGHGKSRLKGFEDD